MPPKSKRNAPNQHDKRHENGLAAPGKRIPKQRSSSNLNGSATNGKPNNPTPPPTSDVRRPMTLPASTNDSAHHSRADADTTGKVLPGTQESRDRTSGENSPSVRDNVTFDFSNGSVDSPAGRRTTESSTNNIFANGFKGNPLTLATTIIAACPLCDVLSILIILLQLGPTSITILQALFTTLTFITPTTSTSLSTIPTLNDMFQGSGGAPSWGLVVFFDFVILVVWLSVQFVPFQNLMVDMSQAVIAISLGGAAAGKGGTTNSLFVCVGIVLVSHLARCGFLPQSLLQYADPILNRSGLGLPPPSDRPAAPRARCTSSYGWIRGFLGTHILAQGLLRMLRRYLHRRDQLNIPSSARLETETGAQHSQKSNFQNSDVNADSIPSSSTDGRTPGLPPVNREGKDKPGSTKRRKRHANQVRSQQPFWAAIASTKVVTYRELEENSAINDHNEILAQENKTSGELPAFSEVDRIWILNVTATDISFGAHISQDATIVDGEDKPSGKAKDQSIPFFVRVNGALWRSTHIRCISTNNLRDEGSVTIWKGEIQGLTAFSNYSVEFVRRPDDKVLYTASLITAADPCADQSSSVSTGSHQTLRPSSPATTLRNSIAAAEQSLAEVRSKFKRSKRDHKASLATLKKDVDALGSRLSGSGNQDDRQRARLLQLNRDVANNEDAADKLEAQIQAEADIPEEEFDEHAVRKQAWLAEKNRQASVREEFEQFKAQTDREIEHAQTELTSTIQKRERNETRIAKQNESIARLAAATAQGKDAQERRTAQRNLMLNQRAEQEQGYINQIEMMERAAEDMQYTTADAWRQITELNTLMQQHTQSIPSTPDVHHANLHHGGPGPIGSTPRGNNHSNFPMSYHPFGHPTGNIPTPSSTVRRGRSGSTLSGVSFTDDLDDVAELPSPHDYKSSAHVFSHHIGWGTSGNMNGARKGSGGSSSVGTSGSSSSGGASGTGSQRDPMSPQVQTAVPNSPVGNGL